MKRVFYYSLFAVLCVSMLSAAIPVRVIAEKDGGKKPLRNRPILARRTLRATAQQASSIQMRTVKSSAKANLIPRIQIQISQNFKLL